jgi:hypothetical protein
LVWLLARVGGESTRTSRVWFPTSAGNPSRLSAVGNGGRFIDGHSGVALISCTVCGGVLQSWQEPKLRVYRMAVAPELKYPHVPAPPSPMPIAAASFQNGYSETV